MGDLAFFFSLSIITPYFWSNFSADPKNSHTHKRTMCIVVGRRPIENSMACKRIRSNRQEQSEMFRDGFWRIRYASCEASVREGDFGAAAEPEIIGYGSVACVRPFLPSTYPSIIREGFFTMSLLLLTEMTKNLYEAGHKSISSPSSLGRCSFSAFFFFSYLKIGKCSRVVSIDRDRPIWSNHTHTHTHRRLA